MITPSMAVREAERVVNSLPVKVRSALAEDPEAAALSHLDLRVTLDSSRTLTARSACPVEGIYFADSRSIVVHRSASTGRVLFSILHEVGHSLVDADDSLTERLLDVSDDRVDWATENMANEIASRLLIPDELIDACIPDERGPRASDVVNLIRASKASVEACAVAAARRLPGPGYVLVVEPVGVIRFAATHGSVFPMARNTAQPERHILRFATDGHHQTAGVTLRFPHGGVTNPMHADSEALSSRLAVAVLVDGPAVWVTGTTVLTPPEYDGVEVECDRCGRAKMVYKSACRECDQRRCGYDDCQWCPCRSTEVAEVTCSNCFTLKPTATVTDGVCRDCSE